MPYVCIAGNHLADAEGFCGTHNSAIRWISSPPGNLPPALLRHITSFLPLQDHVNFSSSSIVLRGTTSINPRLGRAVREWCDEQTKTVKTRGFSRYFFSRFMENVRYKPQLHDFLIHACSFKKVDESIKGNCVLLIRFFDGTVQGLLPPTESPYTKKSSNTQSLTLGTSEAHISGEKEKSPYVSMTGHLPSLLSTSCNSLKMIMYGPPQQVMQLIRNGVKFEGVHPRAAAIGVFLVAGREWTMPSGSTSDRIHLAIGENEVLFDTRKEALANTFLFKVDNLV